jgi:hypothetical protein
MAENPKPRIPKPGPQARKRNSIPVNADALRRLYAEAAIEQREANGDLTTKVVYSKHVDPPLTFAPPCTRSRRKAFFDSNATKVAEVHYYECPDGSIAASGRLDPKEVFHDGNRYIYDQS